MFLASSMENHHWKTTTNPKILLKTENMAKKKTLFFFDPKELEQERPVAAVFPMVWCEVVRFLCTDCKSIRLKENNSWLDEWKEKSKKQKKDCFHRFLYNRKYYRQLFLPLLPVSFFVCLPKKRKRKRVISFKFILSCDLFLVFVVVVVVVSIQQMLKQEKKEIRFGLVFCKKRKKEQKHHSGPEEQVFVLAPLLENTCVFSSTNHNGCRLDQQLCRRVAFTKHKNNLGFFYRTSRLRKRCSFLGRVSQFSLAHSYS